MPASVYEWDFDEPKQETHLPAHVPDFITRAKQASEQRRANAINHPHVDIELTPTKTYVTKRPITRPTQHPKHTEYFNNSPPWYVNALMGIAVAKETINTARTLDRGYELVSLRDTRLPF